MTDSERRARAARAGGLANALRRDLTPLLALPTVPFTWRSGVPQAYGEAADDLTSLLRYACGYDPFITDPDWAHAGPA